MTAIYTPRPVRLEQFASLYAVQPSETVSQKYG